MTTFQKLFLVIIILFGFILRIYQLDSVPASLYYDEVDTAYQAKSLIETGKDYRGLQTPFYTLSFNDPRTPLPAYLTAVTTLLFDQPEYQVRMPSAILGTLTILLLFVLVYRLTGKYWLALTVSFVAATNPWMIQFSRWSHEAFYSASLFLLALLAFYKWMGSKRFVVE